RLKVLIIEIFHLFSLSYPQFIYMVYYIDRLSYVEPSLHLCCYISIFISDFINFDALFLPFEKVPWGAEKKVVSFFEVECFNYYVVRGLFLRV
ncbi:hypothetical protein STEG23_013871, partial [Scotinomys teguina]